MNEKQFWGNSIVYYADGWMAIMWMSIWFDHVVHNDFTFLCDFLLPPKMILFELTTQWNKSLPSYVQQQLSATCFLIDLWKIKVNGSCISKTQQYYKAESLPHDPCH